MYQPAAALERWIREQYLRAAELMRPSISPVTLIKRRPGFAQTIRPARGSIVASAVLADYDPDPDYFFHWFRDSAVIIDALRMLYLDGTVSTDARIHFADFVRFSLSLRELDGRALSGSAQWRERVAPDFVRFLREPSDLEAVHGELVVGETRVNADASLDISKWARPQHDGPPLRALALLRWLRDADLEPAVRRDAASLIDSDLEFTLRHAREPAFDMWEEEKGLHYHTLCVSAAALEEGARWLESAQQGARAGACRAESAAIRTLLDGFWLPEAGYYRSRILASSERSPKELDIAVVLAAIHGGGEGGSHSVRDPKVHATLARLEALFAADYPINRARTHGMGTAMGRYAGDVYYSGGAYYFSTLGAAELCFRAAQGDAGADWFERGDAFLATVRAFTPPNGEMSEQFDQRTGAQTSARHLAWSYAAFVSCVNARRKVEQQKR
jgi:Glycosyl hydrolases family 15